MSHTLGPWKVFPADKIKGRPVNVSVPAEGGWRVTLFPMGVGVPGDDETEREANASLVAAAPEMLDALKAIVNYGANPQGPFAWEILDQAKAVIAKAEGKS